MLRLTLIVLAFGATGAWAGNCDHERRIDQVLDLGEARHLAVIAGAGDLEIEGRDDLNEARIRGTVCASEAEWADAAGVETRGGPEAEIAVRMPDYDDEGSWGRNRYLYIDLVLEVPSGLALSVKDSSGDMQIRRVGELEVRDSSGSIDIENVDGRLTLSDSSGDIDLRDLRGDLLIEADSSGDIYGRDILGSVRVLRDSSGDIRFEDVGQDVIVERDSSGSIIAKRVGGDFRVLRDGSGGVSHSDVRGEVQVPHEG